MRLRQTADSCLNRCIHLLAEDKIDRIKEKYLHKAGDDSENFSSYLNTITKQIKDIEHLLNEFSDFARMPKPILRKVDINKIVSRALRLNELSETKIKFIFHYQIFFFLLTRDHAIGKKHI